MEKDEFRFHCLDLGFLRRVQVSGLEGSAFIVWRVQVSLFGSSRELYECTFGFLTGMEDGGLLS